MNWRHRQKKRAKVSSFVKFRQVKQVRYAKNGKQNTLVPPERSGKQLLYLRIGGATIEELDITTAEYKESSHDRDPLNTHESLFS